jgi:hypothetical protein
MIAPLAEFQKLLSRPMDPSIPGTNDHLLLRLRDAIGAIASQPEVVGPGDIAVLVRQAMSRARSLSDEFELRVPRDTGWPNEGDWERFGCDARVAGKGHYFVRPRRWEPSWLDPRTFSRNNRNPSRRSASMFSEYSSTFSTATAERGLRYETECFGQAHSAVIPTVAATPIEEPRNRRRSSFIATPGTDESSGRTSGREARWRVWHCCGCRGRLP